MSSSKQYTAFSKSCAYRKLKRILNQERQEENGCDFLLEIQKGDISPTERESVVCDLLQIAENLELSENTRHLAVRCFDLVLCKRKIEKDVIGYLAVACLCIAAKFEGNATSKIVQYRQAVITSLHNEGFNVSLDTLELTIMQTLSWRVAFITPSEISQYAIATLDLQQPAVLEVHAAKIINFTLTGTTPVTLDYHFCIYEPSIVALSAVLVSAELQGLHEAKHELIERIYRARDNSYIVEQR